ncbi:ribbon-helix-helix domain-containing protein [Lichenifustis flavocetrariae]|uniref:Ribbon-helix-helix domain-containing protein n=1 Tax=Lichenifustis flavocetrariae TaxID=2949735 RepID=A0AA42CMM4_9HYPH|nr:ribbon-helix-helix domain-containing protein [Lichenifustis flavocetrariae]MCW6508510.1 ribbon-helix-helix domain-containing protein [Lichenifustis flavocetrariae]
MRDARRPRAASAISKRSMLIAGHPTSISLEEVFWEGLKLVARDRGLSVAALVTEIDESREAANLSSAIRVFLFNRYKDLVAKTEDRIEAG